MISYEQDSEVIRWGLQLFDGDPFSNCGYCGNATQNELDYYSGQYYKVDNYDVQCGNIEHDEQIARALQEELSQLAVEDTPEPSPEGVDHFQPSVYSQEWLTPLWKTIVMYVFVCYSHCIHFLPSLVGNEDYEEEIDNACTSSPCSNPGENSYSEDECYYSLELTDEYALDGEVGKRLNTMVPVPHVPRINGEIPSVDEATLDHQRLLDRLQLYDLVELKVQGDGNCQFRALSDQIYRTTEHHKFVRQEVVNQLKSCPEIYEGYVPMAYGDYLKKMSKSGEWGDHVTLQAVAD
ncbi:OTU domain [Dillenia turbinata]|uniref:OTU domain n=1 Tax=Dillenia turbinata TaxID=194707 RepID=A0AAN8V4Z9_9MAGN